MKRFLKILTSLLTISASIGCDQITKYIAQARLISYQPVSFLNGLIQFEYMENTGAMLGIGANLPHEIRLGILIVLNGIMLAGLLWFIFRAVELKWMGFIGGLLIVGGGLSNLIDRIINDGAVIDFVHVGIGPIRTGIFNVADALIFAGCGLILLWGLRYKKIESKLKSNGSENS